VPADGTPVASLSDAAAPGGGTVAASAAMQLIQPSTGVTVTSPVALEGVAVMPPGQWLAAVVYTRAADGSRLRRGAGRLALGTDDRFTGVLTYTLPAGEPGLIELVAVDAASGRPMQSEHVEVNLAAAP